MDQWVTQRKGQLRHWGLGRKNYTQTQKDITLSLAVFFRILSSGQHARHDVGVADQHAMDDRGPSFTRDA